MRVKHWAFAGAMLFGIAALIEAQQPGRQRPGQPGRGQPGRGVQPGGFPGGPGGGFGGGFGQRDLTGMVTTNKDLQAELKISDDQKDKLKTLTEQRQVEMRKLMEKFAEDSRKEFEAALTPEQKTRLKQIEVQNQGLRAFTNEANAKALNLTDAQKTKIKAITDDANKVIQETRREGFSGGFDREKMEENNKKVQKLTKSAMADISDTLTPEQQKVWRGMVGEPFDTSKLNRFGGFGGGGGGRTRPMPKKD